MAKRRVFFFSIILSTWHFFFFLPKLIAGFYYWIYVIFTQYFYNFKNLKWENKEKTLPIPYRLGIIMNFI